MQYRIGDKVKCVNTGLVHTMDWSIGKEFIIEEIGDGPFIYMGKYFVGVGAENGIWEESVELVTPLNADEFNKRYL